MEEKNDGKNTVYDLVLEQVEDDAVDSMNRADAIFMVIYKWLDKELVDEGWQFEENIRESLHKAFDPYMP